MISTFEKGQLVDRNKNVIETFCIYSDKIRAPLFGTQNCTSIFEYTLVCSSLYTFLNLSK